MIITSHNMMYMSKENTYAGNYDKNSYRSYLFTFMSLNKLNYNLEYSNSVLKRNGVTGYLNKVAEVLSRIEKLTAQIMIEAGLKLDKITFSISRRQRSIYI